MSRSFEQKELIGHTSRGGVATGGGCALVFSVPFMAVGVAAILRGLNVITVGKVNAPPWVLIAVGAVFALAGLLVFAGGVRTLLRSAQARRVRAMYPDELWRGDRTWDPQAERDDTMSRAWASIAGSAFMFLFLIPFNWWGFFSKEGNGLVIFVVGIFDLVMLGILGYGIYLLGRAVKYGKSALLFSRFPYFLGETFDARLTTGRPVGDFNKVTITLRCVQERVEVRGSGKNRSRQNVCYSIYTDTLEINQGGTQADSAGLPITFELPAEPRFTTRLLEAPPQLQYWELDVAIETPGIDFGATFLLPIYAKAGAPATVR